MSWDRFLDDWPAHVDRVLALFPGTDRCALVRFRGNRRYLAQYIADAQDLTPAEAEDLIDLRLLSASRRQEGLSALAA